MAKYVIVSQNGGIKSDRKKYALQSRSSLTQNVYFIFCFCFWIFFGGGRGAAGLPFYLNRYCFNVMFLPETKISKYPRVWFVLLYGN